MRDSSVRCFAGRHPVDKFTFLAVFSNNFPTLLLKNIDVDGAISKLYQAHSFGLHSIRACDKRRKNAEPCLLLRNDWMEFRPKFLGLKSYSIISRYRLSFFAFCWFSLSFGYYAYLGKAETFDDRICVRDSAVFGKLAGDSYCVLAKYCSSNR